METQSGFGLQIATAGGGRARPTDRKGLFLGGSLRLAPVCTRRHPKPCAKCSAQMGVTRKATKLGDSDQRHRPPSKQRPSLLQAQLEQIAMGCLSGRLPEHSQEMNPAIARFGGQRRKVQVSTEISPHAFQHSPQRTRGQWSACSTLTGLL
jgi:hypothetical protein